jgi:hypothetical protein
MAIHRRWDVPAALSRVQAAAPAKEWKTVHVRGIDDARRAIGFGVERAWQLRRLLASDHYSLPWMTDAQVVERVAFLLARGDLALFEHDATEFGNSSQETTPAARNTSAPRATTPPIPLPTGQPRDAPAPPTTAAVRQPSSAKVARKPAIEPFDQDAQAATLRLAAADGVPFCEICDRRKRERSAPGSHRGAA